MELEVSNAARAAIIGTRVHTLVDGESPFEAIGVEAGRVAVRGSSRDVLGWLGDHGKVHDLQGACVLPGFTDPHVHLESTLNYDRTMVGAVSREDVLERVAARASTPNGDWLLCAGALDSEDLWPSAAEVDEISRDRPTVLAVGGANYVLNSVALAELQHDAVVAGGAVLELDESGHATGVLRTKSVDQLQTLMPAVPLSSEKAVEAAILGGLDELARAGVTEVHHVVKDNGPIKIYQRLVGQRQLPLRVGLLIRVYESEMSLDSVVDLGLRHGFGSSMLKVQGVKVSVDGYFPRGGAYFSEPYADASDGDCGFTRITQERLNEIVDTANRAETRVALHANGDRGLDMALTSYEYALGRYPRDDHRHRIEHFGNIYLPDAALPRTQELGVVAVPNPTFMHDVAKHLRTRLGDVRGVAPLRVRSMREAGITVCVGTDYAGLYPPDPLLGIAALVNRRSLVGDVYAPDEAISARDAVTMYTRGNAWLGFEEDERGALGLGKRADLVVLSQDPIDVAPESIADTRVLGTMVAGGWVFRDGIPERRSHG